jgi:nucleoside-diphosphate-sugar epimerase
MNILVSGASGFFGSNFIRYASNKGHHIYAISRYKQKKIKNVKWLIGNLDKDFKEFKKCEVLIHFASAGVTNRNLSYKKAFEVNVVKSCKFLINASKSGCLKWIIIGSSSEYGKSLQLGAPVNKNSKRLPVCNYGKTKSIFSDYAKILSKVFESKCLILRTFPVLVQFSSLPPLDDMYGLTYGYNTSLSPLMVNHMRKKFNFIKKNYKKLLKGQILDIGSNDGTFLNFMSSLKE